MEPSSRRLPHVSSKPEQQRGGPPSSPSHALPPNNFVGSVGLAPASSAMFIEAGANNLTLIGEVARRGQKDAKRQRVNHGP